MKLLRTVVALWLAGTGIGVGAETGASDLREAVRNAVHREYPAAFKLYQHFHAHPELSFVETNTAARLAEELKRAGFEVTPGVGKLGVVALLRNGNGPTVLVRADMDALPVREQTKLPYASEVTTKDSQGREVPVMHACGHDVHMTCLVGVARILAGMKDQWRGTLLLIGQPAEELGGGAEAMLKDGVYERFGRPDFCLALHDDAELPAGTIGYTEGAAMANVDSVDITVYGVGGHGAKPHTTKDPIVLASQIVLALQTIVSREVTPGEPAVVTVGSIQGGIKHNIIPDRVRLQLTVRSFSDEARQRLLASIQRIARGQALAAGLPEDRLPAIKVSDDYTRMTYNDPELTRRLVAVFNTWFGKAQVRSKPPSTGGEDFGEFALRDRSIPLCMFSVGGVDPDKFKDAKPEQLPSLHSPFWAPLPEPTIKAGMTAMCAAVLDLLRPQ